jgi:hypothetical protein
MARSQTAQNGRPSNEESWLNAFAGLMVRLSLHAASVQATNYPRTEPTQTTQTTQTTQSRQSRQTIQTTAVLARALSLLACWWGRIQSRCCPVSSDQLLISWPVLVCLLHYFQAFFSFTSHLRSLILSTSYHLYSRRSPGVPYEDPSLSTLH